MAASPEAQSIEATAHRPESEVDNQSLISTTATDDCYTFEEDCTIPLVSQVDTAYLDQYTTVEGTDTPYSTDSGGQIKGLDDVSGQEEVENGDSMDWRPLHVPPRDHPPLDYRPSILKPLLTIPIAVLYFLIGLSIDILMYKADSAGQFRPSNTYSYFTARYIPIVIGTITTTICRFMWHELFRVIPYIAMADSKGRGQVATADRSIARKFHPYTWSFCPTPDITISLPVVYIVILFLVPFKAALFSIQEEGGVYVVTIHRLPAWILIIGYSLMGLMVLAITIWLWDRNTGLKWDPTSLADQIALFRNHQTLSYFEELELEPHNSTSRSPQWKEAKFRLGYWHVGGRTRKIWYGVGAIDPSYSFHPSPFAASSTSHVEHVDPAADFDKTCRLLPVLETTNLEPPQQFRSIDLQSTTDRDRSLNSKIDGTVPTVDADIHDLKVPASNHCECPNKRCHLYPYRYPPLISPTKFLVRTSVAAIGLIVSLYAIGAGHVRNGFSLANTWYTFFPQPKVSSSNTTISMKVNQTLRPDDQPLGDFSLDPVHDLLLYAIFFRSLPTLLAGFLTAFAADADYTHSYIQPFVDMYETPISSSKPNPLLLEYFGGSCFQVPIIALQNQHWKVAWFSVLHTLAPLCPILVSGLFTITNTESRVYFKVSLPGFSMVFAFLVIYSVSMGIAWPRNNRFFPRRHYTLADIMAMCHKSHFLWKQDFDISSPTTTKQHLAARIFLSGDRYALGIYRGTDGKRHVGFDIAAVREDQEKEELIDRLKRWWKGIRWQGFEIVGTNSVRFRRRGAEDTLDYP